MTVEINCVKCGLWAPHHAKGMCTKCYVKEYSARKRAEANDK